MRDWHSRIEQTLRALARERHLTVVESEQILKHLLANRCPEFWSDEACKRIQEDVPRRRHLSTHAHHHFVATELDRLRNQHHPRGHLLAKRWLDDSLEAYEHEVRSTAAEARQFLGENRLAYLASVFVLIVLSANAPCALHQEQLIPFPKVFTRDRS